MTPGICPKCDEPVTQAVMHPIELLGGIGQNNRTGVSYLCPNLNCRVVFGVEVDPIGIKEDTIFRILKALKLKE